MKIDIDNKNRIFSEYALNGDYEDVKVLEMLSVYGVFEEEWQKKGDRKEKKEEKVEEEKGERQEEKKKEKKDKTQEKNREELKRIGEQYYLYNHLLNDPFGEKAKRLKTYLSYLQRELEHQYTRKSQIENRVAFLMTFWGLITFFLLEKVNIGSDHYAGNTKVLILFIIVLVLSGIISLANLMYIAISKRIHFYEFCEAESSGNNGYSEVKTSKNYDLYAAMEHGEMALVCFVEGYKASFKDNEALLKKIGKSLNISIQSELVYVIYVIAATFVWGIYR